MIGIPSCAPLSWVHRRHRAERGPATSLRSHSGKGGTKMQSRLCRITGPFCSNSELEVPLESRAESHVLLSRGWGLSSQAQRSLPWPPLLSSPLPSPPLASGLRWPEVPTGNIMHRIRHSEATPRGPADSVPGALSSVPELFCVLPSQQRNAVADQLATCRVSAGASGTPLRG